MIVIYIMYYQGLTMTTCTCQACKNGPAYDNTTEPEALYHRKQHIQDVDNFKPDDLVVPPPVVRTNTPIHPFFAPPTGTSVHSSGTTGTFVLPTGTAGTTETSAPPAGTDGTSAHPTGTF